MPQPQAFERQTDFTERDGDDTDHPALNQELDAVALSIEGVRDNLALIQRDDGGLKNGIVTADTIAPNAFDAVFDEAIGEAQAAAAAAQISAVNADDARDDVAASATAAATSANAAALNATSASASAAQAQISQTDAATSAGNAAISASTMVASVTAAQAAQTAAATSATSASDSASAASAAAASISSGFRNVVTNGHFLINQRNYTGGAVAAANTYTYDRWRVLVSGETLTTSGIATFDRLVNVPVGGIRQDIERQFLPTGTYTISWTGTASCTFSGATRANGEAFLIITLHMGSLPLCFYNGTLGKVQLEMSTVATPFERRPVEIELAMCQRFYESTFPPGVTPAANAGGEGSIAACSVSTAASTTAVNWQFAVQKRITPTITLFNPGAGGTATDWLNTNDTTYVSSLASNASEKRVTLSLAGTHTAGKLHTIHAVASAEY